MSNVQKGIIHDNDTLSRHLFFSIQPAADIKPILSQLATSINTEQTVVGFGEVLTSALNVNIDGLKTMPAQSVAGVSIPSTPYALWCGLRGNDRGELFHRSDEIEALLAPEFVLEDVIDCFTYDESRDLSGYIDGTENPTGDEAINAAIVHNDPNLNGSSFVAIQTWLHDFEKLKAMSEDEKDDAIGRHIKDNEEFDAPKSAHVKRSAQEDFDPEAFMLRRSMPWSDGMQAGLLFVAYGKNFDAFEAILQRMTGAEDGIQDAIFQFTQPVSGAYFWCPPASNNQLDLSALD